MEIVWFKRDLRVEDHAPLASAVAASGGRVIPLYILEPDLWAQPDMSRRHYDFLGECLTELDASLAALGQPLVVRTGDAVEVLSKLCSAHGITRIHTHQETWNHWTYDRDRRVLAWARAQGIEIVEAQQFGVHRQLSSRRGWAGRWDRMMDSPVTLPPVALAPTGLKSDPWPAPEQLGLGPADCPHRQPGGRQAGLERMNSFFATRGRSYRFTMSSPVTAAASCSRLSPYLAFGVLSMREVWQESRRQKAGLASRPPEDRRGWSPSIRSFESRLHWHCHFIQKLEDEPRAEFRSFHSAYRALDKSHAKAEAFLLAWQQGRTGYPLVDACMRSLAATGWLTFRMRAMVMSFAAYHLWLDWRAPALHLARQFTDYEPGIHYSQCQMQSGITGINTIRIYNPLKQSQEQDPEGRFIRRWLPELSDMPTGLIHTPWAKPEAAPDYPAPLVEERAARRAAADAMFALRKSRAHASEAAVVVERHGSRNSRGFVSDRNPPRRRRASAHGASQNQMELDL